MILGIHHVAVSTPNLDRLIDFYCGLLGFEIVSRMDWDKGTEMPDTIMGLKDTAARQAKLRAGNCFIELYEFRSPVPKAQDPNRPVNDHGYTHLCLHVSDLDAEHARLVEKGFKFNSNPLKRPTHSSVYGRDPDGNTFEMIEIFDHSHPFSMTNTPLTKQNEPA